MSKIIKEPFAPRRCQSIIDHSRVSTVVSLLSYNLKRSFVALPKSANASSEDICMIILLVPL
jgi:hypothetical protein